MVSDARFVASPNFGPRRGPGPISLIVLHYTAISCDDAVAKFCNAASEVSSHYLIAQTGELISMVPEEMRAWHAGAGSWGGITDVNSASIGIEIENDGASPFAAAAMARLEVLLADLLARYRLPPKAVIGHSDLAPTRKIDPGPRFDWRRLAKLGLSVWPKGGERAETGRFLADAHRFGYGDFGFEKVLAAFRLRFRPGAAGPVSADDAAIIAELARSWPAG